MDAMRDLLNNIRMVDHPVEGGQQGEGEEEEGEDRIDEWDWGTVRLQDGVVGSRTVCDLNLFTQQEGSRKWWKFLEILLNDAKTAETYWKVVWISLDGMGAHWYTLTKWEMNVSRLSITVPKVMLNHMHRNV